MSASVADWPLLKDAAAELECCVKTLRNWLKRCPYLPEMRGIEHYREDGPSWAIHCDPGDVATIKQRLGKGGSFRSRAVRAQIAIDPKRKRKLRSASVAGLRTKYPAPLDGEGTCKDAARWAGVNKSTIVAAVNKGDLRAERKAPIRLSKRVVMRWADSLEAQPGEVFVMDLEERFPDQSGPKSKNGRTRKLNRIFNVMRRLGISPRSRLRDGKRAAAIHGDRVPEIRAAFIGPRELSDEISVHAAAKERGIHQRELESMLARYAPRAIRRAEWLSSSRALMRGKVAPLSAIEAALRGETWTPAESLPAAPPKSKRPGGRPKGTGKLEYVRTWLETPEAREIIRAASRKWVNHRLADACNAAHPARGRITHRQMKKAREAK